METDATNPETLDVNEIDAEETPADPAPAQVAAPATTPGDFWKVVEDSFAGDESVGSDPAVEWNAEAIKALPGPARQALRDALTLRLRDAETHNKALAEAEAKVKAERAAIEKARLDLARDREQFAALADDPEVKAALAKPVGELPDPMTPEGIQARIDRAAAELIAKRFEPITKAAERTERERKYLEFVDTHPEMRDAAFLAEVNKLLTETNGTGPTRLRTPEAYEIVKGRRLAAESEARRAQEQAARAEAARRVASTTTRGAPTNDIPADVKRNPARLAAFLESNPTALREILATGG
jgi:hypothetical protein